MRYKILLILFFLSVSGYSQDVPSKPVPPRLVNDFVGTVLSPLEIDMLEQKVVAYNDSTSTQIAIVIVNSTQPYDIFDYSLKLGREWGIGQKEKDNGIIILWAVGDRKVRIHTGYGMEGVLPDIYANRIINNIIRPNFQNLNYYKGLDEAVDAIIEYASGEYAADPNADDFPVGAIFIVFLILFLIFYFLANKGNNNGGGSGGRRVMNETGWPYTTYTGWGSRTGNWTGGGFGGGGFGGGGFGGGGFGGFGGGGFGGGGASGGY